MAESSSTAQAGLGHKGAPSPAEHKRDARRSRAGARADEAAALASTSLFAGLSPDELRLFTVHAVRKHLAPGEALFFEGDPCKGLHIIASGRIRVFKTSPNGRLQVLAIEGPGGSIAELPVLDGGPYPASANAIEDAQIFFIARDAFRRFCLDHPEVTLKVLAVVGARLRHLVGIIEELSFATVRQRLIAILVRTAETSGRRTPRGIAIELPGTHHELAQQLGTVRELVSRNLMRLQAEGLLQVESPHILVRDLPALAAQLESQ